MLSEDEVDISIFIITLLSPLLFIESDGKVTMPVNDSIPKIMKPIPVILAVQRPPLANTFSAKMIAANNPIQRTFIHPSATMSRKYGQQQPSYYYYSIYSSSCYLFLLCNVAISSQL